MLLTNCVLIGIFVIGPDGTAISICYSTYLSEDYVYCRRPQTVYKLHRNMVQDIFKRIYEEISCVNKTLHVVNTWYCKIIDKDSNWQRPYRHWILSILVCSRIFKYAGTQLCKTTIYYRNEPKMALAFHFGLQSKNALIFFFTICKHYMLFTFHNISSACDESLWFLPTQVETVLIPGWSAESMFHPVSHIDEINYCSESKTRCHDQSELYGRQILLENKSNNFC